MVEAEMKENMISVVVCTYNQEDTIARTLDSILRQKCHLPIEIIIGEDASTDGTLGVCQKYTEHYPETIRLFANNPNKGVVDNYFDCLLAARGKYIADLAGDDEWSDDEKLERELCVLENNPEVTIVHSDYVCRDITTGEISEPEANHCFSCAKGEIRIVDGESLLVPILTQTRRPIIHLCTSLYRTDAFLKAYGEHTDLFRNKEYMCEDVQLCFLLAMQGRVAYINSPTLLYTIGGTTISNTEDDDRQFHFVDNTTKLDIDLAKRFEIHSSQLKAFFSYRIYALLMHAFRAHSPELRALALKRQQEWGVPLNAKAKIVKFATSSDFIWKMGLKLRECKINSTRNTSSFANKALCDNLSSASSILSFIITYHNEPISMLRECIQSIIALQIPSNALEIILVDDGSKVSPMPELADFSPLVNYIYQENQGLSAARNRGLEEAKGEYIQFVDCDDYLFTEPYRHILSLLAGKDIVMYRFSTNPAVPQPCSSLLWEGSGSLLLSTQNLRAASCLYIFKRSLLGNLRFRRGIYHEDSLFTPQLLLRSQNICVTTLQAYYYRQHEGTIMSKRSEAHIQKRLDDTLTVLLELQQHRNDLQGMAKEAMQRCIDQQVMGYIYFIITLTKSFGEYKRRTAVLRHHGLFPMPLKFYTLKYWLFALLFR